MFSSLAGRISPSQALLLQPSNLTNAAILENSRALSSEILSSFSGNYREEPFFHRRNYRSLIRKVLVISVILDAFSDVGLLQLKRTAFVCLKEFYLFLNSSKIVLEYVKQSSKLWMLLQNQLIWNAFHDLDQEFSTILDVLSSTELNMSEDVKEQIELCREHSSTSKLQVDNHYDVLRQKLYCFLNDFEMGKIPRRTELESFFVKNLTIRSVKECRNEIEFLEEQIVNHGGDDIEPTILVINGFLALLRYCLFLLFRFDDEESESIVWKVKKPLKGFNSKSIADTFVSIPKDFCCPILLEVMKDPVVISTGQTYDRDSISRWMEEGHGNCPKTGQPLVHTHLVPNRTLRTLIVLWFSGNGIPYDPPENASSESSGMVLLSKAVSEATKASISLLVEELENGSSRGKMIAAREIRMLAKSGKENRACIAEAGAIPLLKSLLSSFDPFGQENAITALLNLSIYDSNKIRIMNVEGCLQAVIDVLRFGQTTEARENAAATLFSLSAVHDYKKQIAREDGAIEALADLLRNGTSRGKKDAVTALFNLSTHSTNCSRMVDSGAVSALVMSLGSEVVSEEATGALALIVRQPVGADAVGKEDMAVSGLIGMMRCGTPKGKENAVAALLELCRGGGEATTEKVVKTPALASLLQSLLFTGTKRARRKAASLARRVFRRTENMSSNFGGLEIGYAYAGNSMTSRDSSFIDDVSTMRVPITVPVL